MSKIESFSGEFAFLSNFAHSPTVIQGKVWPTVEHIFQGAKTLDEKEREVIRLASTPGKSKQLGRKVQLRPDWEEVKQDVMLKSLRLKFKQNPHLAQKLLDTGETMLVEGNHWHDNTWGNCTCKKCKNKKGKNLLGKLLMQVRKELQTNM